MIDAIVKRWLTIANQDLKIANLSLTYDNTMTGLICFHSQQCVEKCLKAYLITQNFRFKKTHNIEILYKKCCEFDNDFKYLSVGNLSRYAVEVRYPERIIDTTLKDAQEAYTIAFNVRKFILEKLDTKETDLTLF